MIIQVMKLDNIGLICLNNINESIDKLFNLDTWFMVDGFKLFNMVLFGF